VPAFQEQKRTCAVSRQLLFFYLFAATTEDFNLMHSKFQAQKAVQTNFEQQFSQILWVSVSKHGEFEQTYQGDWKQLSSVRMGHKAMINLQWR